MKLDSIDHFAFTVANIDESVNWYLSSFACKLIYQDQKLAILEFDNVRIALVLPSQERPHLAVEKSDAASFGELRTLADGTHSCFISDPTGNPIELVRSKKL
jgi:catechol 2,3-dioxygenase-like lactoylglutathione lyase family enzyme